MRGRGQFLVAGEVEPDPADQDGLLAGVDLDLAGVVDAQKMTNGDATRAAIATIFEGEPSKRARALVVSNDEPVMDVRLLRRGDSRGPPTDASRALRRARIFAAGIGIF